MRWRRGLVCLVIVTAGTVPSSAISEEQPATCEELEEAHCQKVRNVIRDVWPDSEEDNAIRCFSSESGLFKWSNKANGEHRDPEERDTQYKGYIQMGRDERRSTGFGWELRKQARSALRWFYATGSDWGAWTASGCYG